MRPASIMTVGLAVWALVVGLCGVGVFYLKLLLVRKFMNMIPISIMSVCCAVGVGMGFGFGG